MPSLRIPAPCLDILSVSPSLPLFTYGFASPLPMRYFVSTPPTSLYVLNNFLHTTSRAFSILPFRPSIRHTAYVDSPAYC